MRVIDVVSEPDVDTCASTLLGAALYRRPMLFLKSLGIAPRHHRSVQEEVMICKIPRKRLLGVVSLLVSQTNDLIKETEH